MGRGVPRGGLERRIEGVVRGEEGGCGGRGGRGGSGGRGGGWEERDRQAEIVRNGEGVCGISVVPT